MCTFFHATNRLFHENAPFSIDMFEGEVTYDHKKRPQSEQIVNELLDESRPETVPLSRKKCIYLFDNLLQCKEYAIKGMIEHIYEVKSNEYYGPYPMVLVKKCNANPDNTQIRVEYWQPKHKWKVMEFLTSSFVVLGEIPFKRRPIMMADYSDDFILAKKVFG